MAHSMTGFGASEKRLRSGLCRVELRSVNSRFFEFSSKLPSELQFLEGDIKATVHRMVPRGKVHAFISLGGALEGNEARLDEAKARRYVAVLERMAKKLRLERGLAVRDLLALPGIFVYGSNGRDAGALWEKVRPILGKALQQLLLAKGREGRALVADISRRLKRIEADVNEIGREAASYSARAFEKLRERAALLLQDLTVDKDRLMKEVALLAEHADITEELVRARSHAALLTRILRERGAIGKKLDFTLQEIFREVNTMSAKASSFGVSHRVIQIKTELERIREQIQNIE